MKQFVLLSAILFSIPLHAQYYYKDIIGTAETNNMMKLYKANHIQQVTITGYDPGGTRSEDFFGEKYLLDSNKLKTITRSGVTDESQLISEFDEQFRIVKTEDTSGSLISTANYLYDANGRLSSIRNNSSDTLKSISETEEHKWFYNSSGQPEKMLKVINSKDTTEIRFKSDVEGNIIEEESFKMGISIDKVYYYYDNKSRLTDIVRFNKKAGRLLPDYMFEYSNSNQLIQKITVPSNSSDYLIWRYQYDEKGLKIKEACYTRDKQLTGKIEYNYKMGF